METKKQKSPIVAIITMFFIFAMISFVTNMAAPFGNIWKNHYSWAGMLGNMMNFLAYLFMGIPAGKLLSRIGYKKTALIALAVGFVGMVVQYLSSIFGSEVATFSVKGEPVMLNFIIYLLGAFICGFCVCMLNTVVNPMLNLLGGGGNRGNQLIQTGGTLNSLSGTLTPFLVGALIGTVTKRTSMSDVAPLLFIAMGVFALAFVIILMVKIPEPNLGRANKSEKDKHSAWSFRHLVLGVVAIFFYVGVEVGIPSELNFYLSDASDRGAGILINGALIGGAFASFYWLCMLIGRFLGSIISGKVSTRVQLTSVATLGIILITTAILMPKSATINAPGFIYNPEKKTVGILVDNGMSKADALAYIAEPKAELVEPYLEDIADSFNIDNEGQPLDTVVANHLSDSMKVPQVPLRIIFLILCGLCTSLMWGGIFNLSVEGLGRYTEQASGIFMMMVVGGGVMPLIQDALAGVIGYMSSYWIVVAMLIYILFYALIGSKNVNKDIPTE
ncbi:MAG: MFS transporter [Bacteroidales bacterium]|nr:MFS transporter [Bacteroidales bacterium]